MPRKAVAFTGQPPAKNASAETLETHWKEMQGLFNEAQSNYAMAVNRWISQNWRGPEYASLRRHFGRLTGRSVGQFPFRYYDLVYTYRTIKAIAEMKAVAGLTRPATMIPVQEHVTVDDRGKLRYHLDAVRKALEGVEASRIKRCPICQRFFWAGRRDQPCCSKNCSNALRVRRWREAYRRTYKQRRILKSS